MSEDRGERKQRLRVRKPRRKVCDFCVNKIAYIDYKDVIVCAVISTSAARSCPAV